MEDAEIVKLWKSYDRKLEESLVFNRKNAEDITQIKIQSLLASVKPLKIFAILTGIIWVGFLDLLIIRFFNSASPFFLVSVIIQVLLTKLALIIYLYQLILINRVDVSEAILTTQEKLSRLISSTLWSVRLLLLQLPVWTTFYWNKSMLENGNTWLYILQFIVTTTFIYLAAWFFYNIKYENRNKKWFRLIFHGKEWMPLIKSMDILEQVHDYRVPTNN